MPVEITDERVAAAAARLHGGEWWFSPRQLYYAVCADVELSPVRVASGEVGLGLVLILLGVIIAQHLVLLILGGIGLLLVVVGAVTHLQERRPPPLTRTLPLSFGDFEQRFLSGERRWEGLTTSPPPLLSAPADGNAALVVCDRTETAAVLAANAQRIGNVDIVVRGDEPADVEGRRVVVLHDCDPAGCGLVAELVERGADVVDAGINPGEVAGRRLQLIEGAPARMPRDLSAHLDAAQTDWLRSGRRLESATETPEQLVQRLRAAL